MEHTIARLWYASSRDSYVVDTRDILGPESAARYMGKYLTKEALSFERLERLGFVRRWSRSNNWSGGDKMQLRNTVDKRWIRVSWQEAGSDYARWRSLKDENNPLLERVGTDLLKERAAKLDRRMKLRKLEVYRARVRTEITN